MEATLLINPRWPAEVQEHFQNLFENWRRRNPLTRDLFFIATSGTTAKELTQTKFVVLSKRALMASASGVGKYFGFSSVDRVAVTLPLFHVGGLAQSIRAEVWRQSLIPFSKKWTAAGFHEFLNQEKITHTSLVPAQLYDLVAAGLPAPASLKTLFIGGGVLGDQVFEKAQKAGWNPVVTYGATETASMVACRVDGSYRALPHAELRISDDGFLEVRTEALFEGYWTGSQIISPAAWFKTEDRACAVQNGFEILGRASDYAKINGEGVYLSRLQKLLQDALLQYDREAHEAAVAFIPSERRGQDIHLFSVRPRDQMENVIFSFNQNVLPFERIQGFHHVSEIPRTELGKVRWQELR